MKNFLYHFVPENLRGTRLYPLNMLKNKFPDRYAEEVRKYRGRSLVKKFKIPVLACLWNDVVFLSPVAPVKIKKALISAGRVGSFTWSVYKIDPTSLDPRHTIVYTYNDMAAGATFSLEDFVPFRIDDLKKYSRMPRRVTAYFKRAIAEGERPLLFHGIPHILYKGSIDISHAPVITV